MITRAQLKQRIKAVMDAVSGVVITPEDARQQLADELGDAFADYVDGRQTTVTGTSATGGAVTGTGTIQGT